MDEPLPLRPPPDTATPGKPLSGGRRVVRRLVRILGLLLLIGLVGHASWTWKTGRDLQKRIDALTSAGEPATIHALQPAAIDPSENAYTELSQAMDLLANETPAAKAVYDYRPHLAPPLTDDERKMLQAWIDEQQEALRLIELAARRSKVQSTVTLSSPLWDVSLLALKHDRTAARLLTSQALLDVDAGRHDRAIARLVELDTLARSSGSVPLLVPHLVASGIRYQQAQTLCDISPHLKIGQNAGDASPESVRAFIAMLLDPAAIQQEQLRALQGERVAQLDMFQRMEYGMPISPGNPSNNGEWPLVLRYVGKPYLRSNSAWCVDAMTSVIGTLDAPDIVAFKRKYAPVVSKIDAGKGSPLRVMSSIFLPTLGRPIELTYRLRTERHLAATALAIRLYEVDKGRRPDTLDALVPDYLASVPDDLMAATSPLKYRAAGEQPILWSIGDDETDNAGDATPRRRNSDDPWHAADRVVFLTPQPRKTPATQEAP